jgi:hypothetical protein
VLNSHNNGLILVAITFNLYPVSQNLITAILSAQDAAEVQQFLTQAKAKLSFLLSLQTDDVITLFKVGNAYLPFIDLAYETVVAHPEILPGVFDKDEFIRDYNLLSALRPIFNKVNELLESIQKTFTAVGSDAMVGALEVYTAVKQNKDKVPGLAATADQMSVFFKKTKKQSAKQS